MEMLDALVPFGAALLAYWLGSRAYFRQKEFELVRSRYLEEGVDRVAAQIEEALSSITHYFTHAIEVLRAFRDVGADRAVQVCGRPRRPEPGTLELVAVNRLQDLVQDDIFWSVRQLLYSTVQEYHSLVAEDMFPAIQAVADGGDLRVSKEEFLKVYEKKVINGYLEGNRFPLLLSCLHEIASVLQSRRLTLKSVRDFHKEAVVARTAKKLRAEFGPDLPLLEDELRKMGLTPRKRG